MQRNFNFLFTSILLLLSIEHSTANSIGEKPSATIPHEKSNTPISSNHQIQMKPAIGIEIELLAKDQNISYKEAEQILNFSAKSSELDDYIEAKYSDKLARNFIDVSKKNRIFIEFIGKVPNDVIAKAQELGIKDNITFSSKGIASANDQGKRVNIIAPYLSKVGYHNFIVYYDPVKDVLHMDLKVPENATPPSKATLVKLINKSLKNAALPAQLKVITEDKLELIIIRGSGPIIEFNL